MKKFLMLSLSLLFVSSLVYSDINSDLQIKKDNTQKAGISYTVVVSGDSNGDSPKEYTITEKGNAKLFEAQAYEQEHMILVSDNKMYQIPAILKTERQLPLPVIVLSGDARSGFDKEMEKFKVPDYKDFKVAGKETANGYQCQVLTKVLSSEQREDEYGGKYLTQDSMKVYVTEKYGYPTKIESVFTSKDMKGNVIHNEVSSTIDYVKFNTNISDKIISLPKNAMVMDLLNQKTIDTKAMKYQYLNKLKEQYRDSK